MAYSTVSCIEKHISESVQMNSHIPPGRLHTPPDILGRPNAGIYQHP